MGYGDSSGGGAITVGVPKADFDAEVAARLSDKAETVTQLALKARQSDLVIQGARIDTLVTVPNTSFYQKSASGITGALLVVASGATAGQINLANVTPLATGYTAISGDYVLLVYGVASGNTELTSMRTNLIGENHSTANNRLLREIAKINNTINYIGSASFESILQFESGNMDGSAVNYASTTSVRSIGFLTFNYNQICKLHGDPSVFYKIYAYALDGTFDSIKSGNLSGDYVFTYNGSNFKYKIVLWYTDSRVVAGTGDISKLFSTEIITLDTVIKSNVTVLRKSYVNPLEFAVETKYYATGSYNATLLLAIGYINSIHKTLYIRCTNPIYSFKIIQYSALGVKTNEFANQTTYTIQDDGLLYQVSIDRVDAQEIISNYQAALQSIEIYTGIAPTDTGSIVSKQYVDSSVGYGVVFNKPFGVIKAVVGHELNMYYDDFVSTNRTKDVRFEVTCADLPTSIDYFSECIRITPVIGDIGTHTITVKAFTVDYILISSVSITLTVIAELSLPAVKKVMFLGDSLTEAGTIQNTVKDMFGSNFILYGTRGATPYLHEGRSSWAAGEYTTLASKSGVTNSFWNPGTSKFDFSYYMTNNPTFADVGYVNIYLGQNDGYTDNAVTSIQTIIASIKAFNPNIIVTVCTIHILPDNNDGCGLGKQNVYQYRVLARAYNEKLVVAFGSVAGVILVPTHLNIDTKYDYPHANLAVSARNTELVMRYTNNVHLDTTGYQKVADVLYNWFVSLFS